MKFFDCQCGCGLRGHSSRRNPHGFVILENGCHEWTGTKNADGYGILAVNGKNALVHRFFYEKRHGRIPKGKKVLHTCDNPPCIRDEHLYLGTQADNVRDMIERKRDNFKTSKKRTHCHRGHKLTAENTYEWHGTRRCKQCNSDRQRSIYRNKHNISENRPIGRWVQ